ncbi:uncharacterized protein EV420DRAFT_1713720 [Desarmillaria tabescens]|uniref:NAD(P)-binding protein n=1 Tax=Armillaria tabescens TaxID=1929756 RepID=A0AA39MVC7_ARMTA|nr:uncharacterized protein EV420DRAFT_1713720 [Desarmillaria tabescens]KAK0447409.1 hypothetical protein EV420DRAFT_1713720 [Desarmillaria tabescens]
MACLALAKELQNRNVVATVRSTTPLEGIDTLTDVDITSDASIAKAVQHPLVQELDIIIINAAVGGLDSLLASSPSTLESHLVTNIISLHHIISACLPALRQGREKKIIFMSSSSGFFQIVASPTRRVRSGVYSVSKAALNMLTAQYADEMKEEGYVIMPVHPGSVATDMGSSAGKGGMEPSVSARRVVDVVEALKKEDNANSFPVR